MRIGGLATGMDIDALVEKLMSAERIPLDKMSQDKTTLEWQRDSFRDMNLKLSELDKMMLDMKMSKTYNSKTISSSQEGAVTATGSSSSSNGTYEIAVTQLASSAINVSQEELDIDPNKTLKELGIDIGSEIKFSTYDIEEEKMVEHTVQVTDSDTLNSVLSKFNKEDKNVRAFYDPQSKKVFLETTRTGNYNKDGAEIVFENNSPFVKNLKLTGKEVGGTDAEFHYNGIEMTSKDNSYKLNDITFQFKAVTDGDATLTVTNDVEASFESIMKFVDKYNEVIETLNESQREEKFRDFKPLTDAEKKGMSDKEIELWEERAKSGILKGESAISNGLFSMRQSWYAQVETGGEFTSLTQIGIKTSANYMDGGKLIVDEDALRNALQQNPDDVQKLFSSSKKDESRGLVNRLEDSIKSTMDQIRNRAGNGTDTLENYTLGKRMKDLNNRISSFEDRLTQVETRYWNQFTAMEKAISRMNQQSEQLFSQFGGGM
ncbi:flagellar hook-associated protein 2 [Virgibacillus halotolerans]|uniref:flagellar hook-associated protein 2 n=1 Tax=Virgibacillus halotolerans TaxID=1071053 RepID=UPI001960AC1C|nr:flagellar hook-associated protein 2 [Virgibacillus halotolerans]MBM7600543.1 flagellar hook-associated protein 2 [Virgibacillus halotolerans]